MRLTLALPGTLPRFLHNAHDGIEDYNEEDSAGFHVIPEQCGDNCSANAYSQMTKLLICPEHLPEGSTLFLPVRWGRSVPTGGSFLCGKASFQLNVQLA